MNKIILLIGAPGAGKGTQGRFLQERLGILQISTGDMFRALGQSDTPLARQVRQIQSEGKLLPDELTIKIVEDRTSQDDCRSGYILDGFPRTLAQAASLETLAESQNKKLQAVLIDVPLENLEKRMTGRRSCPVCGEIYNIYFRPPIKEGFCDYHPETPLKHRADDTPEKVKVRLATYQTETAPLIEYYRQSNRLESVNGEADLEEIYKEVAAIVQG